MSNEKDSDDLLNTVHENWPQIMRVYQRFEDKNPVLLIDIQEQRIYAYEYAEFKAEMSERSQRSLEEQYEKAVRENKVVVFVRDNEKRRLASFSMDLA